MRRFLIFTFICLFSIFGSGQEKKDAAFLQLSFEMKDNNFCLGDSAKIVAKLTNTNKNPEVIDVNRIGYVKYFDRYIRLC